MLYLSTRNTTDCYTAYRALNEAQTPDGGFFVPFRLPVFSCEELSEIKALSSCEVIAKVLNLFLGLRLSGWDVECAIGRHPLKPEFVNQRLLFAEGWRNPEGSFQYLLTNLYRKMTGRGDAACRPSGWAYIAIEIALLFGLYAAIEDERDQGMDVAAATGDFADITAILYAKQMGLPINIIICTSNENSATWDLITKGEFHTGAAVVSTALPQLDIARPAYMELFVFKRLGIREVQRYLDACERKAVYRIDEEQLQVLSEDIFAAVVSTDRVDSIVTGMYRANGYTIDPYTALAYGGLQDYRSHTGVNRDTLFLAKQRPAPAKE